MTKVLGQAGKPGNTAATVQSARTGQYTGVLRNYGNDAGQNSATFATGPGAAWRRLLLGGVAASAMWAGGYRRSYAACTTSNPATGVTQVDCYGATSTSANGDHAANATSIGANGNYGYAVWGFVQGGDGEDGDTIIVNVAPGATLSTTGDAAFGINAVSRGGNGGGAYSYFGGADGGDGGDAGDVTIDSKGSITTTGTGSHGIYATSQGGAAGRSYGYYYGSDGIAGSSGNISVTSAGAVTVTGPGSRGIFVVGNGAGTVTITSTADITTGISGTNNTGIFAISADGALSITNSGKISTGGDYSSGIQALNTLTGVITIDNSNSISTTGGQAHGIDVDATGTGDAKVTNSGSIDASGSSSNGIDVSTYSGALTIDNKADITATAGSGISGRSYSNDVEITSVGNISGGRDGIGAHIGTGSGAVTITSTGDITSSGRHGIYANAYQGAISVKSTGNIDAYESGVLARNSSYSSAGNISVDVSGGAIKSAVTFGINATSQSQYGTSGDILVTSKAAITSARDGIFASTQSNSGIDASSGPSGYNGSNSYSNGGTGGAGGSGGAGYAGYAGGAGGSVTISNTGPVTVTGSYGSAISAASRGGQGGDGGNGGNGGNGGYAYGLYSNGGNGGNGGDGGSGGVGGDGGAIIITSSGDLATSNGAVIYARSSGGQGGEGGSGGYGGQGGYAFYFGADGDRGVDGDGGKGGNGGAITITSASNLTSGGFYANGIAAISNGGDGGEGENGGDGGDGGAVNVSSTGDITLTGGYSSGIVARSTGGDGGYSDYSYYSSSGSDGNGGKGGDVTVTASGTINVTGHGVSASSYGGSVDNHARDQGGHAGAGGNVSVTVKDVTAGATGVYARSEGGYGGNSDYGNPGNGAVGGTVGITVTGDVVASRGVIARSEGGDGGHTHAYGGQPGGHGGAGGDVTVTLNSTGSIVSSNGHGIDAGSFGGDSDDGGYYGPGGNGGAGGSVTVVSSGDVTATNGAGIHAQSRGESGNSAYFQGGHGGSGGGINITATGNVSASGYSAIVAVSTGGGGGNADSFFGTGGNGGDGGDITITTSGDVTAGNGWWGIQAFSAGGYRGSDYYGYSSAGVSGAVLVDVKSGTVSNSGTYGGAVAASSYSNSVTLKNAGTITAAGVAIDLSGTDVLADNTGMIAGNISLSGFTSSAFNNMASGIFESGATANLGSNGVLTNSGTLSPGGDNLIQTTMLTGNFVQTGAGVLKVDADWTGGKLGAGNSDLITVTGAATIAGTVVGNPINFPTTGGLEKTFTIVTAAGGLTNTATATDTASVDFSLVTPDANTLDLNAKINFNGVQANNLNTNQTNVGSTLNSIVAGGGTLPFIGPLMTVGTQDQLGDALDQLAPLGDGASFSSTLSTGQTFAGQMLSCRVPGEVGDANRFIREGQCLWARANATQLDRDNDSDEVGFEQDGTFFSAGVQLDAGNDLRFGFAAGFEDINLETLSNATSDTERLHLGAILKYNPGPWLFAGSLTGGHGWSDLERHVSFGGFNAVATAEADSSFIGGRLTAAYLLNLGHAYLRPQVDAAVTHLERDGYTETATGGIALDVDGADDTVFAISPSFELGTELPLQGAVARPFLRAGFTWLDTDEFTTVASFVGVPGSDPFEITNTIDELVFDLSAGVDMIGDSGFVLRLQYDGRFGEDTTQHGGTVKVSAPF